MITLLADTNVVEYFKLHDIDLAHGANCQCVMGTGIAKQLRDDFPGVYEADQNTQKGNKKKLGYYTFHDVVCLNGPGKKRIYNLYTQFKYGREKRQLDYEALQSALTRMVIDMQFRGSYQAIIPWIGCYNAGGDKQEVMKILEKVVPEDIELIIGELTWGRKPQHRNGLPPKKW